MEEFIWHWTKGNTKIFTRKSAVARQAMENGLLVKMKKHKPRIIKF
ncbi:MAG: hypothetical protein R6U21_03315 [Thermoplasmatota archaeon]